ncbi:MAG: hypothetical protein ACOC06_03245 [Halorubrum sp.]
MINEKTTMADGGDEPAPDRGEDGDPPGRLARVRTGVTEAVGVVADAVLDAI